MLREEEESSENDVNEGTMGINLLSENTNESESEDGEKVRQIHIPRNNCYEEINYETQ